MKESDLFLPVKNFLLENGCSEVYGEVLDCDVLGISGSVDMVVELKKTLSFKLIDQAIQRLDLAHYVYIAVPKRRDPVPRSVKTILSQHKIGLLEIGKAPYSDELHVYVTIPARFSRVAVERRKRFSFSIRKHIKDYHKTEKGGVKSGEGNSDYSIMMENVKDFLRFRKRGKWTTIDEILEHCETHYANPKPSLAATLQAEWNQDWCESKVENRRRVFRYIPM